MYGNGCTHWRSKYLPIHFATSTSYYGQGRPCPEPLTWCVMRDPNIKKDKAWNIWNTCHYGKRHKTAKQVSHRKRIRAILFRNSFFVVRRLPRCREIVEYFALWCLSLSLSLSAIFNVHDGKEDLTTVEEVFDSVHTFSDAVMPTGMGILSV